MEPIEESPASAISSLLKSNEEYRELLAEFTSLVTLDLTPESPQYDRFALLAVLIQEYEARNFVFEPIDAVDAILHHMDQAGLQPKDLIPYLGSRSKVSEVLNRKRALSLKMIRALHEGLDIPLKNLIR